MPIFRNLAAARWGFYLANVMFIVIVYHRIDNGPAFWCIASGIVIFSYFVQRAIRQLVGGTD